MSDRDDEWTSLGPAMTTAQQAILLAAAEWFSTQSIKEPFTSAKAAAHLARMAAGRIGLSGHRSPAAYDADLPVVPRKPAPPCNSLPEIGEFGGGRPEGGGRPN